MALTKIYGMAYEVDGDQITIEQDVGCGETSAVYLNRIHLELLAQEAGVSISPEMRMDPPTHVVGGDSMQQLEVEVDEDGTIHLLQTRLRGMGGSDEQIDLHPMQAAWLAQKLQSIICVMSVTHGRFAQEGDA